jgi:hypothetical protein
VANADFFTRLGFLVVKDFFDAETRAGIRSEVRAAASIPASVREGGASYVLDREVRKADWADVSAPTESLVEARLLALIHGPDDAVWFTGRG